MKYYFVLFISFSIQQVFSQNNYWQQQVNYNIEVELNDVTHSLDAFENITYFNQSPDTLYFIWFHLWPNAYKNDKTAFAEQTLRNGSTEFYFTDEANKGYINQLNFKVDNTNAITEPHPKHIDIIKLILPKPLPPKQHITITTPFHVQLPYNFSRGGHVGNNYQLTQWYPKPAVYDHKGWHEMPYLDQGEFYSEFGNYNVQITLPENYIVAASGTLQNKNLLEALKTEANKPTNQQNSFLLFQEKIKTRKKIEPFIFDTIVVKSSTTKKTLSYQLQQAHDFAWFASKLFVVNFDSLQLNNKVIDIFTFYYPWSNGWNKAIQYAKDGIKFYTSKIGEYPYNIASIVAGSNNSNSGGMEYPSITLITTQSSGQSLDATIVHEIGHNWFYGALASNERNHAWMDEGMNSFYQNEYETTKYKRNMFAAGVPSKFFSKRIPDDADKLLIHTLSGIKKAQPIDTFSAVYNQTNYGLYVYLNAKYWMQDLQNIVGTLVFDSSMKYYYQQWKFKHPYPTDFKTSFEQIAQKDLSPHFNLLHTTTTFEPTTTNKKIKLTSFFSLKDTEKYNNLSVLPIAGYNYYDKLMFGAALHNFQLPLNTFQYFLATTVATQSKQINYAARLSYNVYKQQSWLAFSLSTVKYTMNNYTPSNANTLFLNVSRIVPSIQYTLYDKNANSTQRLIFKVRTFILKEDALAFTTIVENGSSKELVNKAPNQTIINQFSITNLDSRVLYPYQLKLCIDQGKSFIRAGFTANYFFNFSKTKGGIDARFFAGKFIYTTPKTFYTKYETDRYQLNMTGAKGYEDYTYSNYFLGRNEFEGWMSQQIMQSDGFFKVRTDLLSNKIGKSDNWLMAINVSGNIPQQYNILNALPIKIPLHFFVDIGTYADAWNESNASGKFLYDAGFKVPLFNSFINIYIPILYSKVYSNYFKSTLGEQRFLKTISFNIDLQKFQINKLSRNIPL